MTGLTISRYFTSQDQHPFDAVAWEVRDAVIVGKDGLPVFEARGVEFPTFWSQRATDIVASKYFRIVGGQRETSVKQMIRRVAVRIGQWGVLDGYVNETSPFVSELTHILLHQYASFNSPVWFNVGVQEQPQTSACYVLDVEDSMESILEWYRQEGVIFKGGSGAGVNISKIRAKGSPLSNGGVASGAMSFARVADANAGAIKSGGSTRRAAKLLVLDVDHPEIADFIRCKVDAERLAGHLMDAGYGNGIEGGAYDQVPWQNANNSVNVPDVYMVDAACRIGLASDARERQTLFHTMVTAAWECGDPGLFFGDTINAWHTTPGRGEIVSANPCLEVLQSPNTACNLASINLLKFLNDDGSFDIPAFTHTVDVMITAMDIMIDRSSYPTEAIAKNSKEYRPLGLGYCNLGALLMAKGLPYDSDTGRSLAASITAIMTGEAYSQSGRIAEVKGAFAGFVPNQQAMQDVLDKHIDAIAVCDTHYLSRQSYENFNAAYTFSGTNAGYRNCQVTVLAPCGTISFMMDADTTGIEPCLGLVTTKKLVGGGEITMVNGTIRRALTCRGYRQNPLSDTAEETIEKLVQNIEQGLWTPQDLAFQCALGDNPISWQGHIKMVAAVQPFISGGISKTVNMPHDATVEDVRDAYVMAWQMGLKAISIYRDGSKGVQPVTVGNTKGKTLSDATKVRSPSDATKVRSPSDATKVRLPSDATKVRCEEQLREPSHITVADCFPPTIPQRLRLPDERRSITHKFTINIHEGYLTVGLYPDGRPGELFVRMAKEGSTLGGLMDTWATVMSIALQYGVPLEVLTTKLKGTCYEPAGFTGNSDVRTASSITDYIAQWMEKKFAPVLVLPATPDDSSLPAHMRSTTNWYVPAHTLEDRHVIVHNLEYEAETKSLQFAQESAREKAFASLAAYSKHGTHVMNVASNGHDASSAPICSECGAITARNGSCYVCLQCGSTTGCS